MFLLVFQNYLKTSVALSSHCLTESKEAGNTGNTEVIAGIVIIVLLYKEQQEVCRPEELSKSTQNRLVTLVSE